MDIATIEQLHRRNLDRIREIQARQERERGTRDPQAINDERNRAILEEDANIPKSGGKRKYKRTKKRKSKRKHSKRVKKSKKSRKTRKIRRRRR